MTQDTNDRFLSRWSRLKQKNRQTQDEQDARVAPSAQVAQAVQAAQAAQAAQSPKLAQSAPAAVASALPQRDPHAQRFDVATAPDEPAALGADNEPLALPSLDSLTPKSDFRPFMQAGVDALTRNSALKRLFADPHFNVMDGLDTYIGNYNTSEPIPAAMLAQLKQLHSIGVVDDTDDLTERVASDETSRAQQPSLVASANPATTEVPARTNEETDQRTNEEASAEQAPTAGTLSHDESHRQEPTE